MLSLFALSEQCCQPLQWEGTFQFISGSNKPSLLLNKGTWTFSYDSHRKMINMNGTGNYNGNPYVFRRIYDFTNNLTYLITYGQCSSAGSAGPFFERCLNGTKLRDAYIGVGSSKKHVHIYQVKYASFTADVSFDDDCLVVDGEVYHENILRAARVIDTSLGIKDDSVFDIPDICRHV